MNNLGKANVRVEVLHSLPGIVKNPKMYNFDVTASNWESMKNSPYFSPQFVESIQDSRGEYSVLFPTRRKLYINNYINKLTSSESSGIPDRIGGPYISWSVIRNFENRGIVSKIAKAFTNYTVAIPGDTIPKDYKGPEWTHTNEPYIPPPNDWAALYTWAESLSKDKSKELGGGATLDTDGGSNYILDELRKDTSVKNDFSMGYTYWLYQTKVLNKLFWGIESFPFLPENKPDGPKGKPYSSMPFCVNIKILKRPPLDTATTTATTTAASASIPIPNNTDTVFIISLGLDDEENALDIVLNQNARPLIIDYTAGRKKFYNEDGSVGASVVGKEFDENLAAIFDSDEEIEVQVMTIAGRLIIFVNKVIMSYTRVDKTEGDAAGTIREFKISPGRVAIYGSNVQAKINVCPLIHSPYAAFVVPIISVAGEQRNDNINVEYSGINAKGKIDEKIPVAKIPNQPDKKEGLWGVDCNKFIYNIGSSSGQKEANTDGFGFHRKGSVFFINAKKGGVNAFENCDFYIILMKSSDAYIDSKLVESTQLMCDDGSKWGIWYWGCPFYYRTRGAYKGETDFEDLRIEEVPDVISVSETSSAPDYFHALSSANITIYNKDRRYDYLRNGQYGIRISWGWGENLTRTFTGIIISASSSESAGKEMLTIQCEDYMTILKNTPIINSPFYDGMVMFYAIKDLATRAGVENCQNDQPKDEDEYFLPSGYAFTKPVMKFPSKNMIFNCMIDIVKRFEAFIRFDSSGNLHVYKLPGGILGEIPVGEEIITFGIDPTNIEVDQIILNEKNVEYNFASTVNTISVLSIDRDSRNAIIHSHSAGMSDILMYKKASLIDQAALGGIEEVRRWAHMLGKRMFKPIRKINFATTGGNIDKAKPLSFAKVCGLEYRIMSVSKKYNADSNDLIIEYGCEWLNG